MYRYQQAINKYNTSNFRTIITSDFALFEY